VTVRIAHRRAFQVGPRGQIEEVVEIRGPKATEDSLLRLFGQPKQGARDH
jgi:hypothetical protein